MTTINTITKKAGTYPLFDGYSKNFKKGDTAFLADGFYFLNTDDAKDAWWRTLTNSGGSSYRAKPNNDLLDVVKVVFV